MYKRFTYEFIKKQFKKENYILISKIYINSYTKLNYICDKDHRGSITWNNFQKGNRCKRCYDEKQKLAYSYIKDQFEKEGYILLSKEYINSYAKLDYICNKGHKGDINWDHFKRGQRCKKCFDEYNRGKNHCRWKNYSKEELQQLENYRNRVIYLSGQNYCRYYYIINPHNYKRGKDYHLDHIYSIIDGFENNIKPEVMSSPVNLRVITAYSNTSKNSNSDITLSDLNITYSQFIKEVKGE